MKSSDCTSLFMSKAHKLSRSDQDILDAHRMAAAAVGLCLRPRIFQPLEGTGDPDEQEGESGTDQADVAEMQSSPSSYTATSVRFLQLRHPHGLQGVLQIHQAAR